MYLCFVCARYNVGVLNSLSLSLSLSLSHMQPSAPCELVKHTVLWVEETSKRKKLMEFLKDPKQLRFVEYVC